MADVAEIRKGIAEYIGCEPDDITGFALSFEYVDNEAEVTNIHSVWSGFPTWHLTGFVDKLKREIERHEAQSSLEAMLTNNADDEISSE